MANLRIIDVDDASAAMPLPDVGHVVKISKLEEVGPVLHDDRKVLEVLRLDSDESRILRVPDPSLERISNIANKTKEYRCFVRTDRKHLRLINNGVFYKRPTLFFGLEGVTAALKSLRPVFNKYPFVASQTIHMFVYAKFIARNSEQTQVRDFTATRGHWKNRNMTGEAQLTLRHDYVFDVQARRHARSVESTVFTIFDRTNNEDMPEESVLRIGDRLLLGLSK